MCDSLMIAKIVCNENKCLSSDSSSIFMLMYLLLAIEYFFFIKGDALGILFIKKKYPIAVPVLSHTLQEGFLLYLTCFVFQLDLFPLLIKMNTVINKRIANVIFVCVDLDGPFSWWECLYFCFIECVFRREKKMNADSVLQGIWANGSDLQPEPSRPQEFVEHRRQFLSPMWVAYKTLLYCYNLWKQNPVLKGRFSFHYQNEFHNRRCKTEFCFLEFFETLFSQVAHESLRVKLDC